MSMKRKFAKPKVSSPSPTNWNRKPYKSPIKMKGPTRWVESKIERNGKEYEIKRLVSDE